MSRLVVCARCARTRPHNARGLCGACRVAVSRAGRLDDYPATRTHRDGAALVEDYRFLVVSGVATRRQAAERLGVTKAALEKAIARHPRSGEETA